LDQQYESALKDSNGYDGATFSATVAIPRGELAQKVCRDSIHLCTLRAVTHRRRKHIRQIAQESRERFLTVLTRHHFHVEGGGISAHRSPTKGQRVFAPRTAELMRCHIQILQYRYSRVKHYRYFIFVKSFVR
jgi:hypothetical protein